MKKQKEPLISAEEWFENNNVDLSVNIEYWIESYATYHTNWHLENIKEVVINETDVYLGVTVQDIEQSITTTIDNYKTENL